MDIKKFATIIGILTILMPAGWATFSFVATTQAFQEGTQRRHLQEDIWAARKRIWDLEKTFPDGMPPAVTEEYIRLKAELEIMMKAVETSR